MTTKGGTAKQKCMYWDKCYRKDASHKRNFLHPGETSAEGMTKCKEEQTGNQRKTQSLSESQSKTAESHLTSLKRKTRKIHKMSDDDTDTEICAVSPPKKVKVEDQLSNSATALPKLTRSRSKSGANAVPKLTRSRSKSMSSRPKCKYWMTCTSKDQEHLDAYQHPRDILVSSFNLPSSSTDVSDAAPLPLVVMNEGDQVKVTGGLRGEITYTVEFLGGVYSCTCSTWQSMSKAVMKRTCKHIQGHLGQDFDLYRLGKITGGPGDETITRTQKYKCIGSLMLAHKFTDDINPKGWWMSEKLDGVRAYWDGQSFYSRLGNEFIPPSWFVEGFPHDIQLDGELFGGRGQFQSTVSIVKSPGSGCWSELKYFIFDAPNVKEPFENRIQKIRQHFEKNPSKWVNVLEHVKCEGKEHLQQEMAAVSGKGGEGVMIRKPKSPYEHRRSNYLLKVKTFHDAEALVIGHQKGTGKNASVMGALICKMECGQTFKVGTGFTDAQRRSPPAKGTIITYKFQEYTNSGKPRFPSYIGIRIDIDGPKDAILPPKPKAK